MTKIIRFFITGPGVVLVVVGIAITVAWIIKQGQDKQRAETEKHQVQRPLGKVKPSENVDASQASKESVLSNRRLSPGFNTAAQTLPISSAPAPVSGRPAALPTLVTFYAQVAATPSPDSDTCGTEEAARILAPAIDVHPLHPRQHCRELAHQYAGSWRGEPRLLSERSIDRSSRNNREFLCPKRCGP